MASNSLDAIRNQIIDGYTHITVKDIVLAIRAKLDYLTAPDWYDRVTNRLKGTTIIESGTVTTVTTVTTVSTVTTLANMDGHQAKIALFGQDMAAWQLCVRARIV